MVRNRTRQRQRTCRKRGTAAAVVPESLAPAIAASLPAMSDDDLRTLRSHIDGMLDSRQGSPGASVATPIPAHVQFELRSVCGASPKPFAVAEMQSSGTMPAMTIEALSSMGLKKRIKGKRFNQDCAAVRQEVGGRCIAVVADGHGEQGHLVAGRLCESLPELVSAALGADDVQMAMKTAFGKAQADLERYAAEEDHNFDKSGAAATAVVLLPDEGIAYMVSCGDCQAVIYDVERGVYTASHSHKAHDTKEQQRILDAGGSIKIERPACRSTVLSRVYGALNFGLAMSRSFGDGCLKGYGVTAEPTVSKVTLPKQACVVMGSDGLFEFMSPGEVLADLEKDAKEGSAACVTKLVHKAQSLWDQQEGGMYCDDISCVLFSPSTFDILAPKFSTLGPSLVMNPMDPEHHDTITGCY